MSDKVTILFLCTGNSCRSQMAEGFANSLKGDWVQAFSAGTIPQELNQHAVLVMKEIGVDISTHKAKSIEAFGNTKFDYVVTVCDDAHEHCPYWTGCGTVIHRGFDDPPRLAVGCNTEEEALNHYRRVRDEIKEFVLNLPESLVT